MNKAENCSGKSRSRANHERFPSCWWTLAFARLARFVLVSWDCCLWDSFDAIHEDGAHKKIERTARSHRSFHNVPFIATRLGNRCGEFPEWPRFVNFYASPSAGLYVRSSIRDSESMTVHLRKTHRFLSRSVLWTNKHVLECLWFFYFSEPGANWKYIDHEKCAEFTRRGHRFSIVTGVFIAKIFCKFRDVVVTVQVSRARTGRTWRNSAGLFLRSTHVFYIDVCIDQLYIIVSSV